MIPLQLLVRERASDGERSGSVLVMMFFWEAYVKVCVFIACMEICLQLWFFLIRVFGFYVQVNCSQELLRQSSRPVQLGNI